MSKKQQMDPIEENQVKLVMRTADLIKSSIRMACLMQQAARMNPEDIISTIVMGVGDFIMEFTDSPECRKELLKCLTEHLEYYINNANNPNKEGN